MWETVLVLVYINVFGAVIYVLLCGQQDCHRDTFIERCNHFLLGGCFEMLARLCGRVFGRSMKKRIDDMGDRCCNKPNPLFQILYLACVLTPFIFFMYTSWHLIPGPYTPAYHKYLSFLVIGATLATYFIVCRSDPGRINAVTHPYYKDNYPYDNVIFEPKFCKSCNITRPARSTHCRICDTCVSRFDHHCVWINNCVGERNQKKFIAFLLATAGVCFYGFLVTSSIVFGVVETQGILHYVMKNRVTGEITPISYSTMFVITLFECGSVVMVMFFTGVMGVVMLAFALYHIYLVANNTTTAETFKWGDLKHDIEVAKKLKEQIGTIEDKGRGKGKNNRKGKAINSQQKSGDKTDGVNPDEERFTSELYKYRKELTYTMRKRITNRTQGVDPLIWFEHKGSLLDRERMLREDRQNQQNREQKKEQKVHQRAAREAHKLNSGHPQEQPKAAGQRDQPERQEEDEEDRRYRQMTEEQLNREFLRELRWLVDVVPDNIYDRGLRENFSEILMPISERKMVAAHQANKRK